MYAYHADSSVLSLSDNMLNIAFLVCTYLVYSLRWTKTLPVNVAQYDIQLDVVHYAVCVINLPKHYEAAKVLLQYYECEQFWHISSSLCYQSCLI